MPKKLTCSYCNTTNININYILGEIHLCPRCYNALLKFLNEPTNIHIFKKMLYRKK